MSSFTSSAWKPSMNSTERRFTANAGIIKIRHHRSTRTNRSTWRPELSRETFRGTMAVRYRGESPMRLSTVGWLSGP